LLIEGHNIRNNLSHGLYIILSIIIFGVGSVNRYLRRPIAQVVTMYNQQLVFLEIGFNILLFSIKFK